MDLNFPCGSKISHAKMGVKWFIPVKIVGIYKARIALSSHKEGESDQTAKGAAVSPFFSHSDSAPRASHGRAM
jgi:hypothetical protein